MVFEMASVYIPAGASFDGAGALGAEAMTHAALEAGVDWSEAIGDRPWIEVDAMLHHRRVDGETVWGLAVPEGDDGEERCDDCGTLLDGGLHLCDEDDEDDDEPMRPAE